MFLRQQLSYEQVIPNFFVILSYVAFVNRIFCWNCHKCFFPKCFSSSTHKLLQTGPQMTSLLANQQDQVSRVYSWRKTRVRLQAWRTVKSNVMKNTRSFCPGTHRVTMRQNCSIAACLTDLNQSFTTKLLTVNTEQDITAPPIRRDRYGAADTALTVTALGCFGARDNTAPPLRRSPLRRTCAPYNNDSGWPVNERESPALLHIFMHAVSLQAEFKKHCTFYTNVKMKVFCTEISL